MKYKKNNKIYVAMSGGVDSSVAAALLKRDGFDVTGVFFKPWSPNPDISYCNWQQDRLDAMRVATKIAIDFKTWDFSKEYGKHVARYMIDSYRAGITPNPDVMCNKEIKFGLFLKKALKEGADYIATGHYVRKLEVKSQKTFRLMRGRDINKDQSYFLWTLTQKQLRHCLFPIGKYDKPSVRKLAKKFGLSNHNKKDSQGVCFVGELDMKDFLTKYIRSKPGQIKLAGSDKVIGSHDGAGYYTIGQRHGLDIKNGHGPYFVVDKNMKKNVVYVAGAANYNTFGVSGARIGSLNWIFGKAKSSVTAEVRIRYRSKTLLAKIITRGKIAEIIFKKPAVAVTPGQSAVIYRGEEVLGGGIILNR